MKAPDLSFVMPCYNGELYLADAISSCIAQTRRNIEVIVIDDCSTDSSPAILDFYAKGDARVRVYRNKKNMGRGASRNIGAALALAPVIAVLDADDLAESNRADRTLDLMRDNPETIVYGAAVIVDFLGREIKLLEARPFDLKKILEDGTNYMVHSTMAYPRKVWDSVKYDEGEFAALGLDDWKFGFDCIIRGFQFVHTDKILSAYRNHREGISATRDKEKVISIKTRYMDENKGLLKV